MRLETSFGNADMHLLVIIGLFKNILLYGYNSMCTLTGCFLVMTVA